MARSLIVYYGNDPMYLSIVWDIATLAVHNDSEPVLLNVSGLLEGVGDDVNRRALSALGLRHPDRAFDAILRESGFVSIDAARYVAANVQARPEMSETAREGIEETTRSALISYARDPLPNTSRLTWRNLEKLLARTGNRTYAAVSAVLDERPEIRNVYVPNGRFPHQRGALEAALAHGRQVLYYEKGEKPDTFWFADHSPLHRVKTQETVDDVLGHLTDAEAIAVGQEWMNGRSSNKSVSNIYSRFFHEEGPTAPAERERRNHKVIGLFTSSQDEFAALGPEWHLQAWSDQWAAFDHVLSHLEQSDFAFYLRVHPNFATKSHASYKREHRSIKELQRKHPSLKVIWHDEQVSSYAMLHQTHVVIVWDSTIGLEASGRGVPVWELAASYYDLYADVRQWFDSSADPDVDALEYEVDTDRTLRFMAYLGLRESSLSVAAIAVRESLNQTQGLRLTIANVVSSGGAPTIVIGLWSILDSLRHRRFAINRLAARKFFSRKTPVR